MTAILDYCVPSRRRERQERKEQQALSSRVNSRWGDTQITAPSEGGWNQPGSFNEQGRDLVILPGGEGSPQYSGSSVNTTPDMSILYDKAVEAGISIEHRPGILQLPPAKEERKNLSFTITLPWPSRRANTPPMAALQSTNPPLSRSGPVQTNSRPSTAQSCPPTVYVPTSDRYMQDWTTTGTLQPFMNPLAQSPPERAVEIFSVGPYATAPDGYVRNMVDQGYASNHPLNSGPSPVQHAPVDPVFRQGPSPPQQHTTPITRLEPIPATPYCVDNFADDPRMERPEAVMPSHPAVTERGPRARSSSREPHSERYARMRSTSRGLSEDRSGRRRPSSRGPMDDRSSTIRSSSTDPAEDRVGSARSLSRGPMPDPIGAIRSSSRDQGPDRVGRARSSSRDTGPDRLGTSRSSSRDPGPDRGDASRSSSRGPPTERFRSERSPCVGPPLDKSGRPRSTSMGPPAGRLAMVRSASREPTAERLAFTRAPSRDSFSSDSSSTTLFSDDLEETRAMRQQRAPSSKSISNPNGAGLNAIASSGNGQNGGKGGYYSSLASEYRQIAKDVETLVLVESDGSEGREYKKTAKDRIKETYNEPQALVPKSTDLYG